MLTTNRLKKTQKNNAQLTCLDLKYPIDCHPQEISAREFCRRMHGLAALPEIDILRAELEYGYRRKCISLLSQVLGLSRAAIHNWGLSIDFEKMPNSYRRILGVYCERYELLAEVKRLRRLSS
jgi:hypothetical protein